MTHLAGLRGPRPPATDAGAVPTGGPEGLPGRLQELESAREPSRVATRFTARSAAIRPRNKPLPAKVPGHSRFYVRALMISQMRWS